jgi:hypothetical protein
MRCYRISETGVDPHGMLEEFYRKDMIKNIDVYRESEERKTVSNWKRS